MLGLACEYDGSQHRLITPELLHWCKRQASDGELRDSLFVYHHLQVGTFVIARWINHPWGLFVDVLNLGHSLANFDKTAAREFRNRVLCPVSAEATARGMRDASSDFRHSRDDSNAEAEESTMVRALKPKRIMTGYTGA